MSNLEFWDKYKSVPNNALKEFDNGNFQGTDINTIWRMKCLTEYFGMCGIGWYYDIVNINHEKIEEANAIMTFAEIKLYVKVDGEWSKGITGVGGNKMLTKTKQKSDGTGGYYKASDEATKMAVTDAIGNACRNLGIGADVYWSNDKTKYTEHNEEKVIGGEYVLQGGKYNGATINEVLENDQEYIRWCILNAKNMNVKKNMEKAWIDKGLEPITVEV